MSIRVFQSFLGADIQQFLAHKHSLGRRYDVEEKTLALFDAFLLNNKIASLAELSPAVVDEFLMSRPRLRPRSYNHLRSTVGRLLSYLVEHGALAETPLRSPPRRGGVSASTIHLRCCLRPPLARAGQDPSRPARND